MLFLVVDDDALSRDLLTLVLESEGYEVEVAVSGEAAVARALARAEEGQPAPDVVLTDLQMPGLAGGALAIALRPLLPMGTLLLAMSGSQPESSALQSFDGFLLKPFTLNQLRSMIDAQGDQKETPAAEPELRGPPQPPVEEAGGSPEPAALDEEIFARMCDLMPMEQLGQMYSLCVEDARRRITQMAMLAAGGDEAGYRSEAHAVKGGCGMIGASQLYKLAAAAEQDGLGAGSPNPGTTSVTATLAQLSSACDRLERMLQERARE